MIHMHLLRLSLLLMALLVLGSNSVLAQTNEMWVRVLDYKNTPMPQVEVCTNGRGDGCRIDNAGLERIGLSPEQVANTEVALTVLNKEYVLIDPWDDKVRVPLNRTHDVVVRVFRIGDKNALNSEVVLRALVRMINYKTRAPGQNERRAIDPRKAALALIARNSGYTPEELDRSIRLRKQRTSASEKGQYALYSGDFREAEKDFLNNRESSEPEKHELATNEFFLGRTQFQLGEYREAEKSFAAAEALGMESDTNVLDYSGQIAWLKGNFANSIETFERSLRLKEKTLPEAHPDLLVSRMRLVHFYTALQRDNDAQELLTKIWLTCEKALATDFETTAPALVDLIYFYLEVSENSDSDLSFRTEVEWLRDLLANAAERQIQASRSHVGRAHGLFVLVFAGHASDDEDVDEWWKPKVVEMVKELRGGLAQNTRNPPRRGNVVANRMRSRSTVAFKISPAVLESLNAVDAISILLAASEWTSDSDENVSEEMLSEALSLAERAVKQDPVTCLYILTSAVLAEDPPESETIYKIIWAAVESSSALENAAIADRFFRAVVQHYVTKITQEEIKLVFDRIGVISNRVFKNSHALDAQLFAALAKDLRSRDENKQKLVREVLESPLNNILANNDQILDAGSSTPATFEALIYIASLCAVLGRNEDAKNLYSKVLNKVESTWGFQHLYVRTCLIGIARAERALGLKSEAEFTYRQVLANERREQGLSKKYIAELMAEFSDFLVALNKTDEARVLSDESEAIYEEVGRTEATAWRQKTYKERIELKEKEAALGENDPSLITLLSSLAKAYNKQENYIESKVFYEKLLAAYGKSSKPDPTSVAIALDGLAKALENLQKDKEAENRYLQGIALLEPLVSTKEKGSWFMPFILEHYAKLLQGTGRVSEAAKLMERVEALKKQK